MTSELELPLEQGPQAMTVLGIELTPLRLGLLIGVAGVLIAGVMGFTQIRPTLERIERTRRERDENRTKQEQLVRQIESLREFEGKIDRARQVSGAITQLLPTPQNAETQLLDLNRLLRVSNITLNSFAPQPPGPVAGQVPEDVAAQVRQQSTRISIQGNYNQTIQLMQNIERLKTLLRVTNLTINPAQAEPGQPPLLNMSLDLISYIYSGPTTDPPPPAQ
ncbi:MAG: type 4a pilus biogenesis protein PilO [Thermostichales cyanobacterium GMQP_bins_62]